MKKEREEEAIKRKGEVNEMGEKTEKRKERGKMGKEKEQMGK